MTNYPIIDLESSDRQTYRAQLLRVFPFEGKDYALLVNQENFAMVIMQFTEQGDKGVFRSIGSDEESKRVAAHLEEICVKEWADSDSFGEEE